MFDTMRFVCTVVCLFCLFAGCEPPPPTAIMPANSVRTDAVKASDESLEVAIDYGDGAVLTVQLPANDLLNAETKSVLVENLMRKFIEHPRAPKIELQGTRLTAFVAAIDELKTDSGMGWAYKINGKRAERGIGQIEVVAGDRIRWEYGNW